jgi:hypothetical protein
MDFMRFRGPGFEMEVPTDWLVTSSVRYQAMFLGPQSADEFRPNLMVTIRPTTEDVSPAKIAEATRDVQKSGYPGFEILDEVDYTEQGGIGFMRRFVWHDDDNGLDVLQMQSFFVVGGAAFTLTATRARDDSRAADLDAIFDHMTHTFRLTPRTRTGE